MHSFPPSHCRAQAEFILTLLIREGTKYSVPDTPTGQQSKPKHKYCSLDLSFCFHTTDSATERAKGSI